ncbi:MAG: hypothetical protein GY883_22925 [Shimia sp.]|nr:hypothetical protein [Shimia sp.]
MWGFYDIHGFVLQELIFALTHMLADLGEKLLNSLESAETSANAGVLFLLRSELGPRGMENLCRQATKCIDV